jgi:hypothetical protein
MKEHQHSNFELEVVEASNGMEAREAIESGFAPKLGILDGGNPS